ncbi:MAG: endonuclease/exonuclease/phosphatase family protein [Prevotella sp.]|jgi:endonuclease/exonuclease/phosphatase family metal-dependent hydrolase|nr:endonuclease/exonuclease/phosphatase family protein [Prevotella sp.]
MKKAVYSFWAVALLLVSCKSSVLELNVMSFNIRYNTQQDGANAWNYRKDAAAKIIRLQDADIVGTQEVLSGQLADLNARLPEYASLGVGRADGKEAGEYSAIFYKKNRFKLLESGNFWLSETPELPGKKGWDAACERIATWGIFEDVKTGKRFLAMNTHLDHVGKLAQKEGVNLLLARIGEYRKNLPVILTGDFNMLPDNPAIRQITDPANPQHLVHTQDAAEKTEGQPFTYHNYGKLPAEQCSFIDYIFADKSAKVLLHSVIAERLDGVYLSDHAPVEAKLQWK